MRNKTKKQNRKILNDNHSQIIVLTGVMMVMAVIFISSLAPDIANLSVSISNEKANSMLQDFIFIKKTFPHGLNYKLNEEIELDIDNNILFFRGDINNIDTAFTETRNEFHNIMLSKNVYFEAGLNGWWVAHPGSSDGVYHVDATLTLRDSSESHSEDVLFSIVCKPTT